MIAIENTLISDELFTEHFICDLSHCKGICCIEGDAGAPLDEEEIPIIETAMEHIRPFMTEAGQAVVDNVGVFEKDGTHFVTPLVNHADCAFLVKDENGLAGCAIEKAFEAKKINFQKPISCHLYPIRISQIGDDDILNYHRWSVCKHAVRLGKQKQVRIFEFLSVPLRRKYGDEWYNQLQIAYNQLFKK